MNVLQGGSRRRTRAELKKWWEEGVRKEKEFLQYVHFYSVLAYRLKIYNNTVFLPPALVEQFVRAVCWNYITFSKTFSLKKLSAYIGMNIT